MKTLAFLLLLLAASGLAEGTAPVDRGPEVRVEDGGEVGFAVRLPRAADGLPVVRDPVGLGRGGAVTVHGRRILSSCDGPLIRALLTAEEQREYHLPPPYLPCRPPGLPEGAPAIAAVAPAIVLGSAR